MATRDRPAGVKNGWRFHVSVYLGMVGGGLIILASALLGSAHLISGQIRDGGLVVGGMLLGLIALSLNEFYRIDPERAAFESDCELERQRHQEERRLDFEQYRAMQTELREMRSRGASLQSKLELTGALDRDRVGDALLLGFHFHRRGERLPSPPHALVFKTAARRLKLIAGKRGEIKLERHALRDVLEMTYGPIIAEAFDLGILVEPPSRGRRPSAASRNTRRTGTPAQRAQSRLQARFRSRDAERRRRALQKARLTSYLDYPACAVARRRPRPAVL